MILALRLFLIFILSIAAPIPKKEAIISFSGLQWVVKEGRGGPGGNLWRKENVWLDEKDRLHLTIRKIDGEWACAEVYTREKFLYGNYSFRVVGRIDRLDKNVVLGLFAYPGKPEQDGTNEIDIEFSRWGEDKRPPGNYTIWPDQPGGEAKTESFDFGLFGSHTTHIFERSRDEVSFASFHGHSEKALIAERKFTGTDISREAMPIHLNLWLFKGQPPSDEKEVEIIISGIELIKKE